MYTKIEGMRVRLYLNSGRQVRQFDLPAPVAGVQVSGESDTDATVVINMQNGKTNVYMSSGRLIRKS